MTLSRPGDDGTQRRGGRPPSRQRSVWATVLYLALAAACVALVLASCGIQQTRTPEWIEIPAGYRGYIVLQYSDPGCPALERRDGYEVIRFGGDGRACTSDISEEGAAKDRLFYVYEDGSRVELNYQDAGFGSMFGGGVHRVFGKVFAVDDAVAKHALWACQWGDSACWRVLRQSGP